MWLVLFNTVHTHLGELVPDSVVEDHWVFLLMQKFRNAVNHFFMFQLYMSEQASLKRWSYKYETKG